MLDLKNYKYTKTEKAVIGFSDENYTNYICEEDGVYSLHNNSTLKDKCPKCEKIGYLINDTEEMRTQFKKEAFQ